MNGMVYLMIFLGLKPGARICCVKVEKLAGFRQNKGAFLNNLI